MQLRDIEYVLTLAAKMSFTKAAQELFISQPALSQSIRRLERELKAPLFLRENNTLELTKEGKLFVEKGKEIIRLSTRLKQEVAELSLTKENHLRIGISPFYSNYYLPRIIPAFRSMFPSVRLDIVEKNTLALEESLLKDEVDFCLLPLPIFNNELDYRIIHQEQILLAIPPNHSLLEELIPAMAGGLPLIDLQLAQQEPFVFLKKEQRFYDMGMELCREAGFEPRIVFETTNWDTVNALVTAGMGIGFVPEIVVHFSSAIERPSYCQLVAQKSTRSYAVAFKKGRNPSATANQFIRIAQKSLQALGNADSKQRTWRAGPRPSV